VGGCFGGVLCFCCAWIVSDSVGCGGVSSGGVVAGQDRRAAIALSLCPWSGAQPRALLFYHAEKVGCMQREGRATGSCRTQRIMLQLLFGQAWARMGDLLPTTAICGRHTWPLRALRRCRLCAKDPPDCQVRPASIPVPLLQLFLCAHCGWPDDWEQGACSAVHPN
jgi:hypothetical protein